MYDPKLADVDRIPVLDTVGIAYRCEPTGPVDGCSPAGSHWGTAKESERYQRKLGGGGFMAWGMGDRCWVEASLPKAEGGSNVDAVSLGVGLEVLAELVAEAQCFVPPNRHLDGDDLMTAKVVRADLVRDFHGVDAQNQLLDSLADQSRDLRWNTARFSDSSRAGAATLSVGPKSWKSTLYDKHHETGGGDVRRRLDQDRSLSPSERESRWDEAMATGRFAPEGQLRFEARLHHAQLVSVGASVATGSPGGLWRNTGETMKECDRVFRVGNLAETNVVDLRKWMFDRVGYGKEIMSTTSLRYRVFRPVNPVTLRDDRGLLVREQRELWAFLTAGELCGFSRNTRSKYRRIADGMNVTVGSLDEGPAVVSTLDLDEGVQRLRVAA